MVRFAAAALALAATLLGHSASGNEQVLLDFWSPTCGPCMQMKPTVQSLVNAGYPIRQIDVSREPQLARQYGVTGIPCFVMLVDGQEVDRIVGATSSEHLVQMFAQGRIRTQSPEAALPARPADTSVPWTGLGDEPARANVADGPARANVADGPARANLADGPAPRPPAAVAAPSEDALWTRELNGSLLSSSVRLRVEDAQGHSYGTGTIIDAREGEALVITCGHLFRESKGKGPVTVELFEAGPEGVRVVEKVPGQVIRYDLERDVALMSIRPTRPVCVASVAPPRTVIERGDRAATVGCSNGQDPTVLATRVTWLDRYQGFPNVEASGAPADGRSGGGLFNEQGQLLGVCLGADYEGNKGLYAGLESIHGELDGLGMKEIYAKADPAGQPAAAFDEREPSATAPVVRGQEPLAQAMTIPEGQATTPLGASAAVSPENSTAAGPEGLTATEQAALEEIMKRRAAGYEVVCIVRPKEPGGQSEVITLDDVSPEFIQALNAQAPNPQAPVRR